MKSAACILSCIRIRVRVESLSVLLTEAILSSGVLADHCPVKDDIVSASCRCHHRWRRVHWQHESQILYTCPLHLDAACTHRILCAAASHLDAEYAKWTEFFISCCLPFWTFTPATVCEYTRRNSSNAFGQHMVSTPC